MKAFELYNLSQESILTGEPLIHSSLDMPPKGLLADRVAIYADGFYIRLEEALLGDYASLASFCGEEEFGQMCRGYLEAYPSYSYTLNVLGQYFSKYLTETHPYREKPWLAEIASFEWAEAQAYTAADAFILTVADLQSLPVSQWPNMKLFLHPSCTIMPLHWNSLSLIEAVRHDNPAPLPEKLAEAQYVMIWRNQRDVRYAQLDTLELLMLEAIKRQESFAELCDCLGKKMPEAQVANYLVQEIHAWLQVSLFVKVSEGNIAAIS